MIFPLEDAVKVERGLINFVGIVSDVKTTGKSMGCVEHHILFLLPLDDSSPSGFF